MEKLFVYFKADDQDLVCCNPFRVSSKKVAYVEAHFDLGENWTGYDSVRAIWRNTQNFAIIGTVLDSQGICKVPTEVLTSIGQVDVNLVGSISENNVLTDRLTTYPVEAGRVDANALVDGSETAEITPSQFEQFAAAVRNDAERAREGAEAAESYADAAAGSADDAAGSAQSAADDAARIAQMIQDVIEQIEDFYGVTVSVETLPAGSQATARYEEGHLYLGIPKGDKGDTGNGIASITKTGTSGLVDTYTITFTDGQTTTFAVTNGEKGDTGNGIASITKTGTSGLIDTYTITYTDGQTETFTVANGEKGDTGNGIDRIELTSTSGYVKTYTIYFTDGSTTTFEVTDGEVSLEDYYKQFIEDTASGSIASFPDGADDIPMISVLADIEPVQDLHGYDKPWPAGGGTNILDPNIKFPSGDKFGLTVTTDGYNYKYVGTATSSGNIQTNSIASANAVILPAGTYRTTHGTASLYRPDGSWLKNQYAGTFTVNEPFFVKNFYWEIVSGQTYDTSNFISLTKGETLTAWQPYSNECPISGHNEVNVTHTGKNLIPFPYAESGGTSSGVTFTVNNDGSIKLSGTATSASYFYLLQTTNGNVDEIRKYIKENTKYTLRPLSVSSKYFCQIILYGSGSTPTWAMTGSTFTTPSDLSLYRRLAIVIGAYNGAVLNDTIYPQLELGSTASDYETYQGEMKNRQFVDELGNQLTVYGGQDEIIGGVLTVDRVIATITKDVYAANWFAHDASYSTWGFYCNNDSRWATFIGDIPTGGLISDKFPTVSSAYGTDAACCSLALINGAMQYMAFRIPKTAIGTPTDSSDLSAKIVEWLDSNPIQVCFKVTPQSYQLSPQQIKTLLGTNNVWADTGDVTVKYRADTKLYIDKVLAS